MRNEFRISSALAVAGVAMESILSSEPRSPRNLGVSFGQYPKWLLVSAAAHAALLFALAHGVLVEIPREQSPIRVTIFEAAPPPPPLGGNSNAASPAVAEPAAQPQPKVEQPAHPLKIAKQPARKPRAAAETRPPPAAAPPPPEPPRAVPRSPDGAVGGVAGGVVGGQLGGTLGGRGDRVFHADEVASPPTIVSQAMPAYPPLARARGIEGLVVLEGIVDRKGNVERDSVTVVQSVTLLDDAAISALRQWRFRAGRDGQGEAVRVIVQVPIRFRLR
jgi:protein TonB